MIYQVFDLHFKQLRWIKEVPWWWQTAAKTWYIIHIFNRNWIDTQWYSTHLHTNSTQNTEKGEFGKRGPCPVFANYTLAFGLQLWKKHGKTSVRVAQYKNNEQAQYKNNGLTIHRRKKSNTTQKKQQHNTEQQRTQKTQQRKLSITGK
jgi:hypothetical protein